MNRIALREGILAMIAMAVPSLGDIVWNGKRVDAWPPEAIAAPGGTVLSAARAMATNASAGHYSSPKGKVYGLTLLVDFSDSPAPFSKDEISDWLNKPGFDRDGCEGSVRDYYLDVSNGQVDFTNEVFGWYRAKYPKSHYEEGTDYSGASELVQELLAHFDPLVDFSRYDNDKNGTTEALSIVYAGPGLTWGQGLWPHSGWVGKTLDKTKVDRYQMSDQPGKFSLYVFVHECGHMVFGWPDLYWYGDYCTMGNRANDLNPVAINDFFRADQGWIPFVDVAALDTGVVSTLPGEKVYRYKNPARPADEGFAWSYLKNANRSSVIKGSGLLLHHYDFSLGGNSSASKLGLRVVQADGKEELQASQWPSKSNDPADLFQSGTTNHFDDGGFASARWYDGTTSGLVFSNAGQAGTSLSFRLGPPLPSPQASAILEAEKAQVVSAELRSGTDASAGGYVGGIDAAHSQVVFSVNRPQAGLCSLVVRYANGGTRDASHFLSIDGSTDSVKYHPTGGWGRFDSVLVVAPLRKGINRIALTKKADYAELDRIRVAEAPEASGSIPRVAASGAGSVRWLDGGRVEAPAWMAGATLETVDLAGRIRSRAVLVRKGDASVAVLGPHGTGTQFWRVSRNGKSVATGSVVEGTALTSPARCRPAP